MPFKIADQPQNKTKSNLYIIICLKAIYYVINAEKIIFRKVKDPLIKVDLKYFNNYPIIFI